MFRLDPDQVYRAEILEQFEWLEHGFGTRHSRAWPPSGNLATLRQIHSNKVILADRQGDLGAGDALISNTPGLTLVIRTADCLPILIADPENRAIAAVHAGWRGTVQQILRDTVQAMSDRFGSRSQDLVVAIGPAIGECCYEVGREVAEQFAELFPERQDLNGTARINLPESAVRQLRRNGGSLGQIDPSGLCTRCLRDMFHSYRRDGDAAGRMFSGITIRPTNQ